MQPISFAYSTPTSPARDVPSRPTQTTLKTPERSTLRGSTFNCIPTYSGRSVFSFAPYLLTVTIRASSTKGTWLGNVPEILTGHPIFTRALRRNGSELVVLAMMHLPTYLTWWA